MGYWIALSDVGHAFCWPFWKHRICPYWGKKKHSKTAGDKENCTSMTFLIKPCLPASVCSSKELSKYKMKQNQLRSQAEDSFPGLVFHIQLWNQKHRKAKVPPQAGKHPYYSAHRKPNKTAKKRCLEKAESWTVKGGQGTRRKDWRAGIPSSWFILAFLFGFHNKSNRILLKCVIWN